MPAPATSARILDGMEHWSERLRAAYAESGYRSKADLARRVGITADSMRKYFSGDVAQPRGKIMSALAEALGVETLWLLEGVAPRRAGDLAEPDPGESGDTFLHRREVAKRIAGLRAKRGIATPEAAALSTIISGARWRRIESGAARPETLELQAISQRLGSSLDWIVSGSVTPIDEYDPVETERARQQLHEPTTRPPRKSGI